MADRPIELTGSADPAEEPDGVKRIVNPTLVTPGPRPVERDGADGPQVLQGEVVGGKHARPRAGGGRRRTAAGALLSAAGAAAALFLLISRHSGETATTPTHDAFATAPDPGRSTEAAPDRSSGGLVRGAVVGTESPKPDHTTAQPRPAADRRTTGPTATPSGNRRYTHSRWGNAQERKRYEEAMRRWARKYAAEHQGYNQHHYGASTHSGGNGRHNGWYGGHHWH
jgi:hypothetical protein